MPPPAPPSTSTPTATPTSALAARAEAAWLAWLAAAGPWRRWQQCLTLWAPGLAELPDPTRLGRRRAPDRTASAVAHRLAAALCGPDEPPTLLVLDLPPASGARAAASLARAGLAHPVLCVNRWPYARAVLPAGDLVSALLAEARRLPRALAAAHLAVVLDGERLRPLPGGRRPRGDPHADNRYDISPNDLPDAASLVAAGVRRVLDVRLSGSPPVPLSSLVYPRYAEAGLVVETGSGA